MNSYSDYNYIDDQQNLDSFTAEASVASWISVDTEFERVRTFYPRLCLLQIAIPNKIACIDPLGTLNLDGIASILTQKDTVKIFHAARQDIEVLHHTLRVLPTNIFDTQIAASFCGFGEQIGYAALVKQICNIDLPKAFTRTLWCRRPLKDEEIKYASDDVEFLYQLYQHLDDYLKKSSREEWVREDCEELSDSKLIEKSSTSSINKILRSCNKLCRNGKSVAHALAIWREKVARETDCPREWLLSGPGILEIARNLPSKASELRDMEYLNQNIIDNWGCDLIRVVKYGIDSSPDFKLIDRWVRPTQQIKVLGDRMWFFLCDLCERENIPTSAVASRDEIRAFAQGGENFKFLFGWRLQFAGNSLHTMREQTRN